MMTSNNSAQKMHTSTYFCLISTFFMPNDKKETSNPVGFLLKKTKGNASHT